MPKGLGSRAWSHAGEFPYETNPGSGRGQNPYEQLRLGAMIRMGAFVCVVPIWPIFYSFQLPLFEEGSKTYGFLWFFVFFVYSYQRVNQYICCFAGQIVTTYGLKLLDDVYLLVLTFAWRLLNGTYWSAAAHLPRGGPPTSFDIVLYGMSYGACLHVSLNARLV